MGAWFTESVLGTPKAAGAIVSVCRHYHISTAMKPNNVRLLLPASFTVVHADALRSSLRYLTHASLPTLADTHALIGFFHFSLLWTFPPTIGTNSGQTPSTRATVSRALEILGFRF
uniref:Uncharacterized protein n=1 Tax=Ascaris lumbricoides TaxID=6252 RepID=A0A0M3ICI9_ASCLU